MKNKIFNSGFILLLFLLTASCTKDLDDKRSILGTWIESAPVPDRTTLHFAEHNQLTRVDAEGNAEEYIYRLEDNILYLSLASGQEGYTELIFDQINEDRFKVQNLYPSIPEAEPEFIIFDRYK